MIIKYFPNFILQGVFFIVFLFQTGYSAEESDSTFISHIDSSLQHLIQIQKEISDIHPFLNIFHPVVIAEGDYLYIFDYNTLTGRYNYIKKEPTPFPLPKKVRASFPLSVYDAKPSCIVTQDIFDSENGYVTIFHEFMHCCQFLNCELVLKQDLKIAQDAQARNDYSWEINHSFPYEDSLFIEDYTLFIEALDNGDERAILAYRIELEQHLGQVDYEYMVWMEWKEGFARLIENRLQSHLGITENHYGQQKPYNRVTFYVGGSKFIHYLIQDKPDLYTDIEKLFHQMLSYY